MSLSRTLFRLLVYALVVVGTGLPLAAQQDKRVPQDDDKPVEAKKGVPAGIRKVSEISEIAFLGATVLDMTTTVHAFGHPTHAYSTSGELLAIYKPREVGWSGFLGSNPFVTVGANLALNAGVNILSRRLYQRGGKSRWIAAGLVEAKTYMNLSAGIQNLHRGAAVDREVHLMTGYSGPIVWGH